MPQSLLTCLLGTEEERLGLVQGDSVGQRPTRSLPSYEEEDDVDYEASPSDDYAYDDDVKSFSDDKSGRYGRGITDSPQRGRTGSGSSSGNEKGLGIGSETPPRPPAHGSGYGKPRGGGAGGAGSAGTPAAFI